MGNFNGKSHIAIRKRCLYIRGSTKRSDKWEHFVRELLFRTPREQIKMSRIHLASQQFIFELLIFYNFRLIVICIILL